MNVRKLVGTGDRIGLVMLPFIVVCVVLNHAYPGFFEVGGPPPLLRVVSIVVLVVGVTVWAWSVALILTKVPRGELIATGPYAVAKHPLYAGVSLLVLPWAGFLLDTWLGAVLGMITYVASRTLAKAEEVELARTFGAAWDAYAEQVTLPWL